TFLLGFSLAVSPLVAHRIGERRAAKDIGQLAQSGLLFLVMLWSAFGALMWFLPALALAQLSLEDVVRSEAVAYLRMIALGTPFMGVFFALRNTLEGLGHSRPIMWIGFAALLFNIPLDLALMTGWGPFPELGAAGCGLATAIINAWLAGALCWLFWNDARFRPYRPQGRVRASLMREVAVLGFPVALALASEHALFAAGGLLMTRFGTDAMGAAQIALNFTGMMFMIALGLGQATSVLIGQAAGARDAQVVRRIGQLGYICMCALSSVIAAILLLFPGYIAALYTSDESVQLIAIGFIRIAGAFHLVDALQALGSGALRGLKDTTYVMQATSFAYWGVGGGLFVWFFHFNNADALTVWWVYCMALACAALLLGLRFFYLLKHLPQAYSVEKLQ
ncbi:MAG: MATE family efflux transporter, partial [Oceanococcus sp.]